MDTPPLILEVLIDRHGLRNIIELLAVVCDGKAEHIAVNWQDASTAKVWSKRAQVLDRLAALEVFKGA